MNAATDPVQWWFETTVYGARAALLLLAQRCSKRFRIDL